MPDMTPKQVLQHYLQAAREALLWKLDGLSPYDARRPLVPTGTNLLGLVKHVAGVEAGYLSVVFGRPLPELMPWMEDDAPDNADMWATPDETVDAITALYRRVWAASDAVVEELPLEASGHVPWWGEAGDVTLQLVLVHLIAETHRHAGHADILRELVDGEVGMRAGNRNLPPMDDAGWAAHRALLEQVAAAADC